MGNSPDDPTDYEGPYAPSMAETRKEDLAKADKHAELIDALFTRVGESETKIAGLQRNVNGLRDLARNTRREDTERDQKLTDIFIELGRLSAQLLHFEGQLKMVGRIVPPDLTRGNSVTARIIRAAVGNALREVIEEDLPKMGGVISGDIIEQMIERLESNGAQIILKSE